VSKQRSKAPTSKAPPVSRLADGLGHGAAQEVEVDNSLQQQQVESPIDGGGSAVAGGLQALDHAIALLQLDGSDPERLDRFVRIVEASELAERDAIVDRLQAAETVRGLVDATLTRWVGSSSEEARWSLDALLESVRGALVSREDPGGGDRFEVLRDAAVAVDADRAEAVVNLCRTLTLTVHLDEEEEEFGAETPVGVDG
jgi:hypothetical protein